MKMTLITLKKQQQTEEHINWIKPDQKKSNQSIVYNTYF